MKCKGGYKVMYDYQRNIDAKTNRPLTGRHVHINNCVPCAMHSLGYMSERTARYLQRIAPNGVPVKIALNLLNETYGDGHTIKRYEHENIKDYLNPGEATILFLRSDGTPIIHCVIVFQSEENETLIIDPQQNLVSPITEYLDYDTFKLYLVIDPETEQRSNKLITPEIIRSVAEKHSFHITPRTRNRRSTKRKSRRTRTRTRTT